MTPTLLHQSDDFLLVYKPAGMACHGPADEPTLVDHCASAGWPSWLVHRLDRDTSGLLLIATSAAMADAFRMQFADNAIAKFYLGIVTRKGNRKQGLLRGQIGPARDGNYRMVQRGGKAVATRFLSGSLAVHRRWVLLQPLTGRTHQLRVAMKANGSPLLGDVRYGGESADRLYLHAAGLAFQHRGQAQRFFCWPREGSEFTAEHIATMRSAGLAEPWQFFAAPSHIPADE